MLVAIIVEFNHEYGAFQTVGEKDMSELTIDEAHEEAQKFVESLQEFKKNRVAYRLEKNGQVIAYLKERV